MSELVHSKRTAKRPWFFQSRFRLYLTLFLVLAVPSGVFIALSSWFVADQLKRQAIDQNTIAVRVAAKQLNDEFFGLRRYVESYSGRFRLVQSVIEEDWETVRQQLRELVDQNEKLSRSVFTDPQGTLLVDFPHDPGVIGKNFSDRDWFRGVSQVGSPYVSEIYQRAALGRSSVVMIAARVEDPNGKLLGYLGAQYTLEELADWFETIKPVSMGKVTFFDRNGNQGLSEEAYPDDHIASHPAIKTILGKREGAIWATDLGASEESLVSYAAIDGLGWTVISYQPSSIIFGPVYRLLSWSLLFFLVALCIIALLGWLWFEVIYTYSEELIVANKELENFCYSIAHNLRAPLRAMQGFTAAITEDYGDKLNEEGKDYARRIRLSARRMDVLVSDLLDYGRVAHAPMKLQHIRLDDRLAMVTHAFKEDFDATAANVNIKYPLGTVYGDETLVYMVFCHLVSNAIKYVPDGTSPSIEIWSHQYDCRVRVYVKDNGIGIPAEQHERIFGIFERLHGTESYSGTGIGLAIVKKATERMGGEVGLESRLEAGSCFWVELPCR
ncbi:MAG: sensor histidine kinase [Limisphaerales bacterium]